MVRIIVDVKTDSKEESLEKVGDGLYLVRVKAPRRKGKANAAVLKVLRRHFGRPARIISGHTATRKVVELQD